ncbi:histidine phosphatase family protein [Agreia sp. COWG]|uniref:histidine phosphatase family protein n=1 Tax=Agreia sp. COWG TaxID=2773266 RepID=UPI00192910BB|nr:histidine phosphatase family protein [Agreia sp. COWG]CAD6008048.1 putative phosphoglycerate mutase [Agreia sp. COWG]
MSHTWIPTGQSHIRILLIRHAESTANEAGIISTAQPGPELTARGRQQAEALPDAMREALADDSGDLTIDGLYASTLPRTQLTAEPLSRALGVPVTVVEGLHEIEAGDLEGLDGHEAMYAYGAPLQAWALGDFTAAHPGAFDGDHFFERFDRGIAEIWQRHSAGHSSAAGGDQAQSKPDGATVAIVAHDAAIRVWVAGRSTNLGPEFTSTHSLDNTAMVVLTGSPAEGWRVESWQGEPVASA